MAATALLAQAMAVTVPLKRAMMVTVPLGMVLQRITEGMANQSKLKQKQKDMVEDMINKVVMLVVARCVLFMTALGNRKEISRSLRAM
jgi:polyferredoxin